MKKFKFRLQRVLDFRKLLAGEKKRELMLRNLELSQAQDHLRTLEQAERDNLIAQNEIIDAALIMLNSQFGARLRDAIVAQRLAIIDAEDKVEQARLAYIEAAKDEKALLSLKEKKLQEYMHYLEVEQGKALDDFSVSKGNTFENADNI